MLAKCLRRRYHRFKHQEWTRRISNKHAINIWWNAYQKRQRIARNANWDLPRLTQAFDRVFGELDNAFGKLRPIPLDQVRSTFTDLSRSAGFCFFDEKFPSKRDIPDYQLHEAERVLSSGLPKDLPRYLISFRSQIRRKMPKHRVILVSPGPLAMVEKRFAYPLQRAMENAPYPRSWASGWDWFCAGGQQMAPFIEGPSLSLDFESFDMCPPTFLIRMLFSRIQQMFELSADEKAIFLGIVRSHLDSVAHYMGKDYKLTGGIRTGSSFTHIIGTLLCCVLCKYYDSQSESISYGDDVVMRSAAPVHRIADFFAKNSSFSISPTKSKTGVHWLGFQWHKDRWILEDVEKRWAQFFWPERPSSPVARLQCMLLNCLSDPCRLLIITALMELQGTIVLPETIDLIGGPRFSSALDEGVDIFHAERCVKRFHRLD
jgi:hypothetical protein